MNEISNVLLALKREIHDKANYPHGRGVYAFVNLKVFDAVLNNYIKKYSEDVK